MTFDPSLPFGHSQKANLTVDVCLGQGGHCWVATGEMSLVIPPRYPEYCKHCPARRVKVMREAFEYVDTTPKES